MFFEILFNFNLLKECFVSIESLLFFVGINTSVCTFILFVAVIIFYLSHKELADNWSPFVEVKERQKLIKTGIYRYIRHPMYLSMWLFAFFQGFLLSNIFIEIFGILAWSNLYFIRINNEEKIMIDIFGNEYKEYIENTGRIFPKLRL